MIENYELDKIKDFGSMQVTLLNDKLIDNNSAFIEIYKLGNKELDGLILNDNSNHSTFINVFWDYWLSNKERLHQKYFDFCKTNLFMVFDEADTQEFIYDAMYLALIDRIFNYSSKLNIAHDYADFNAEELLYLISLFDVSADTVDENSEYGDFIDMLECITKDYESYDIDEINEITKKGIASLEQFLIDLINERIKLNKYKVIYPYSIKFHESRYICSFSNSLIGICFTKLALKISGYNIDHRYHQCKYYKCINYFTKKQNRTEYCPECIKNNIPNILKNKKFNTKR